jgi:hypothetical protein
LALSQIKKPKTEEWSGPCTAGRAAGSVCGGLVGSLVPDVIDPPTNPNHRGVGHAAIPQIGAMLAILVLALIVRNVSVEMADDVRKEREGSTSFWEGLGYLFVEVLLGFAAEFLIGFIGGNVSHLISDATTPKRLNWFCYGA